MIEKKGNSGMVHIMIASHGPMAAAMVESARLIIGNSANDIPAISVTMDTSRAEICRAVEAVLDKISPEDTVLALTDIYGGSVARVLAEYAQAKKLDVIAGMNLGILLDAALLKDTMGRDELIDYLLASGKDGICYINRELEKEGGEEI